MEKQQEPRRGLPTGRGTAREQVRGSTGPQGQATARQPIAEVDELGEQLDNFVSLVSHELRGPLATLIGYAQVLGKGDVVAPAIREKAIQSILDQAKRMNALIDNLLQASRLRSGRLRMTVGTTDIVSIIQRVVAEQQILAGAHRRLLLEVPDSPIVGDWDAGLLALAFGNLVSNAVKFSPGGGEVRIAVLRSSGTVTVMVTDRGMGIAPEDLPGIFRPYQRPSRTERFPGAGVGLYVVKGIVEAHGGRVDLRSEVDRGSTFSVSLPVPASGDRG